MKITTIIAMVVIGITLWPSQQLLAQQETAETPETSQAEQERPKNPSVAVKREEPDIATLEKQSQEAYEEGRYVKYYGANIRMMNQRPYEPIYMKRVIEACALLERRRTAYHYMLKMQQMGLAYDFSEEPDAANIKTTELFDYLNDLMIEAGEPAGIAEPVLSLDSEHGKPAALTWDAGRQKFLIGTLTEGAIVAAGPDGSSEVLMKADVNNGLWAVTGLHADVERNRLWVATSAVPEFSDYTPADRGRAALIEYNLETLERINQFNAPADGAMHEFGTLAVTDAGDVYVLDRATSMVFRKAADAPALEPFVGSAEMDSVSAIAVSYDNRRLYIADRYKGILVVDPVEQSSVMLTGPESLNLGRINSLAYGDKKLYMVQSGFKPERVMQLELDEQGSGATEALPMASAMESFDGPGLGHYMAGYMYYFANLGNEDNRPVQLVRTALVTNEGKPDFSLGADSEPGTGG